jgi:hypothetical protein
MKINYNVQGKERKAFVNAIAEITEQEATYQGTPTYAYEIGKYTVDRDGALIGRKSDSLAAKLAERGFVAEEIPEENTAEIPADEPLSEESGEFAQAEQNAAETAENTDIDRLTIEYPLDGFTLENIENLFKMVNSKEVLIKKALGLDELPIKHSEHSLAFPWFRMDIPNDDFKAVAQFITQLCKTAKDKKRVTARAQESFENEKFAMRVWLIGLDMKGEEFAAARKLMMRNLSGNSGFRYEDKQPRNPRGERVQKEVVSVRFTAETLGKLAELLSSQSNMSRNQLIESVVCEYVQAECPADDEAGETADDEDAVDTTATATESEVHGDE